VKVPPEIWVTREPATADLSSFHTGVGRELFSVFRDTVGTADTGASIFSGLAA
jgi:phosphogluconate dehydratase